MNHVPRGLASALAERYQVEREIGAGGMATVYLARDLRHKRSVAVKVIRPELAGRDGVDRFLREIELVAGLQHPNILPVFDSGVVSGGDGAPVPYFVMPYVEDETLRRRLEREGRLPVETAARLADEVADALAYAHAHGVIHRDIKPENILLSGGHAVVADFGVAKALESGAVAGADASRLTRAGLAIGTPSYMSPEQATGDAVDARSDQYSLGCVLYEMLAGEPPFAGPSPQSVVAKSLSAPRPHIGRVRPEVPPELEQVALRAMAIEAADRYPDMSALEAALGGARGARSRGARRRVAAAGAAALLGAAALGGWLATRAPGHMVMAAAETLAVLPFRASGPGLEFLGEGMMDLLATNLRGVGGINPVEPRAVLREWGSGGGHGADDLTRAIATGRDLGAGSVVLGNAVSAGGKVRVSADLYSVKGERLARAQVEGPADSVLPLVDRLSVALVKDIWRSKQPIPHLRVASLTTDSIEALRAYLQGEQFYRRMIWDSALTAYNRAVEVDSTFSLAHLRRAQIYGWTGGYGSQDSHMAVGAGVRYAARLSPRDRRLLMGYQLFDQGQPEAIDSLRAFVAAYPDDVEGWFLLGESRHHIKSAGPVPPESVTALFDSVIRRDSTLFPAFIHPLDLALIYRDSVQFARYFPAFARTAPPAKVRALQAARDLTWGPPPTTEAIAASLAQSYWMIEAGNSFYRQDAATSDSVLRAMARVRQAVPPIAHYQGLALAWKASAFAGLGRWHEARVVFDSLKSIDRGKAIGLEAWSVALGLAPPSLQGVVDSALRSVPPGPETDYAMALVAMVRGRVPDARRQLARVLASRDTARLARPVHGLLVATDGWGAILQGDSVAGIRRMREGLDLSSGPNEETSFLRFQFALALAARPETRAEGIRWLRYGFDQQPLYLPLTYLALGHAYELGQQKDSAAQAYGRFLRLWDQADPELQGRVKEARAALQEITRERPSSQ